MCNPSWPQALARSLRPAPSLERAPRIAVVGIGNECCGDDAAGVLLARMLAHDAERKPDHASSPVLVLDAGCAPENVTGTLRRFAPDFVLLVDAAQMDEPPGTVRWLDWHDTTGFSASTHTLPLHMLARYLCAELHCAVALLAIQPAQTSFGAPLSTEVRRALDSVRAVLHAILPVQFQPRSTQSGSDSAPNVQYGKRSPEQGAASASGDDN